VVEERSDDTTGHPKKPSHPGRDASQHIIPTRKQFKRMKATSGKTFTPMSKPLQQAASLRARRSGWN
jgi:hypothetical protein